MSIFWQKTVSFFRHLRNGTVLERIRDLYNEWRRVNFWIDYPTRTSSFEHLLAEGVRMHLYRDDRLSELIYHQDYEADERAFVCSYLKPGMTFVDIGANIGLYSLIAARFVDKNGCVVALEPASKNFDRLLENIRLNGFSRISPFKLALSDQEGFSNLVSYSRRYTAWNSLAGKTLSGQRTRVERVRCLPLDHLIGEFDIQQPIDLMKIDVEGWEYYVLRGGARTFTSPEAPDILIEFSDANLNAAGVSSMEVYTLLEKFGYRLYRIDSIGKRLLSIPFGADHPYDNYLACKHLERTLSLTGYTHWAANGS